MCDKKKSYVIQTHARPPMAAWGSSSGTYLWLSCPAPASIEWRFQIMLCRPAAEEVVPVLL